MSKRIGPYLAAGVMLLASALAASGQALTGNIYGKVVDEQSGVLPGVSVTLSGIGADQTTFTDARGEFHFLNLSPGSYALTTTLQGFTSVRRENVVVTLGKNTELAIPMALSAVSATVTVTSEVPLLDTRTVEASRTFSQAELEKIPTARDPWVILQVSPGVLMDRQNVGGSQSANRATTPGRGPIRRRTLGTWTA